MKAKDTVMKASELISIQRVQEAAGTYDNPRLPLALAVAKAQAEITWDIAHKAGIREVVEWIENRSILANRGTAHGQEWQAKLKEWGIK